MAPVKLRILTVGYDAGVAVPRNAVLQAAGHHVTAVSNRHAAVLVCGANTFDCVLLCHSIPESEAVKLQRDLEIVGRGMPVLRLDEWVKIGLEEVRRPEYLLDLLQTAVIGDQSRQHVRRRHARAPFAV